MPKYIVPSDCRVLADLVFLYLSEHRGQETLDSVDLKADWRRSMLLLQEIPGNARLADFDILEEFRWSPEDAQTIRAATD